MRFKERPRDDGQLPVGAILLVPLALMPVGGWLIEHEFVELGRCAFKWLTGIPCMTCGATRATLSLLDGHLLRAVSFQPLIIGVYTMFLGIGIFSIVQYIRGRDLVVQFTKKERSRVLYGVLAVAFLNWFYLIAAGV